MKSIRRVAATTLFALSSLSLFVSPASAESARGHFNLTDEVHWQDAVLPAGEYEFSMGEQGPSEMLMIRKVDGMRAGFIMLAQDTRASQATDVNRLVLVSRPGGSYVDRLELPQFGVTLHFKVPAETVSVAQVNTGSATGSGR